MNPVVAVNPAGATGTLNIDPVADTLLNAKLPNGQFMIPSANPNSVPTINFPENVFITQPAYFISDQAVSNLDYLATSKDTLSLKYYYQHDPSTAPFGFSSVQGFTQQLDAGSQVASITNTQSIRPNFSVAEVFGFIREKVYSTIGQPFTPADVGINAFGSSVFPGITIVDDLGNFSPQNNGGCLPPAEPCGPFNAGPQYRIDGGFARRIYRNFSESLDAVGECDLESRPAYRHLWRKFFLHATECSR